MQTETIYLNFKGGIISPGYLKRFIDIAAACHVQDLRFGLRQQLIMDIPVSKYAFFVDCCKENAITFHHSDELHPNLVSSYITANTFVQDSWLSEGIYKDVFDLFNYSPRLKINICDGRQTFTPFFSGHLNWISSGHAHFWYLYIRLPGSKKIMCWPSLVYTNDLANLSLVLEGLLLSPAFRFADLETLSRQVKEKINYISKPVVEKLLLPSFHLPYYEGFNKEGNVSWLGIYRRDELYPIAFLQELCEICLRTRIGEIYCSSWKSLVVKGIGSTERKTWDQLLGKYRINVRHAANELNWQVEDHCDDGLILKRHVIRYFDKEDVRTFGLCFAIQTRPSSFLFGSVLIRRQARKNTSRLKSNERFDILHTPDFNPNATEHILFRAGVEKDQLGVYLVSLCKFFYERETQNMQQWHIPEQAVFHETKEDAPSKKLYQCKSCLSVYDETLGDEENDIKPGTSFQQLPGTFSCALCGGGREEFIEIEENDLGWKEAGALIR